MNAHDVGNDQLMSVLLEMKGAMYTKKDGTALKKSVDIKISAMQTELKAHNDHFSDIDERISKLETKLVSADYDRELAKQQALKKNISIFGCPKYDDENVMLSAIKTLQAFGADINESDFSAVYRTTGKKPNFSTIIVKFNSFEKKLAVLNSKPDKNGQKKVMASDVFDAARSNAQIYVNNHVTPFFGRLLAAGRQAIKDGIVHSCWIGTTGCLIKLNEGGKPINVRSLDEFDSLRAKAGKPSTSKRNKPDDDLSPKQKQRQKQRR